MYNFGESKNEYQNLLTCRVANESKIHKENSTLAISTHLKSKLQFHKNFVEGFEALDKEIYYLPQNIGTYFINLKALQIRRSRMKKISSNDLKSYQKLEFLDLSGNNIQILEEYLFQHNSKLKIMWLNHNWIVDIHATAFDGLRQVNYVSLVGNFCYSGIAKSLTEIENILKKTCSQDYLDALKQSNIIEETASSENVTKMQQEILKLKLENQQLQMMLNENDQNMNNWNKNDSNTHKMTNSTPMMNEIKKLVNEIQADKEYSRIKNLVLIIVTILIFLCNCMIIYCYYPKNVDGNKKKKLKMRKEWKNGVSNKIYG